MEENSNVAGSKPDRLKPVGAALMVLVTTLCFLTAGGWLAGALHWGLPSNERNEMTLGSDRSAWCAPEGTIENSWAVYPNKVPGGAPRTGKHLRSAYIPIRSYHPDEYVFFKSLSEMRPAELKLSPGFFGWPAFHIYVVGAALKAASWMGLAELRTDIDYYFRNPEAMARLYVVGRLVTLAFAGGCLLVIGGIGQRLFGSFAGYWAAWLMSLTPLFVINSHYLTGDVPMLFWLLLALLASVHIFQGAGRRWYLLAGLFVGLATATRYQGVIAAVPVVIAHLMRKEKSCEIKSGCVICDTAIAVVGSKEIWLAGFVSLSVFLLTNPYVLLERHQFLTELRGELQSARNPQPLLSSTIYFVVSALGVVLPVAFLLALCREVRRHARSTLFLLLSLGLPAVFLWLRKPVMVRYFLPVLPLPLLLAGGSFTVIERKKVRGIVLWIVVTLGTVWYTFSYCFSSFTIAPDVRTCAGKWIVENVPEGAAIGVVSEPWQFELPPMNPKRKNILVISQDPATLAAIRPAFFVSSNLQFPPIAVRGPLSADEKQFWDEVFAGEGEYSVKERFDDPCDTRLFPLEDLRSNHPILYFISMARKRTWSFLRNGPHDMLYPCPTIVVSQRGSGIIAGQ